MLIGPARRSELGKPRCGHSKTSIRYRKQNSPRRKEVDHKNTAQQQGPAAMPRQAAGQPGSNPSPSVKFPAGPGVCVAGNSSQGLYRIVQSKSLKDRMAWVQSRTPFPLEVVAWLPGTYADSNRQGSRLRHGCLGRSAGDGWYRLSFDDLADARAYLTGEKERLEWEAEQRRQEAARAKEQAAKN